MQARQKILLKATKGYTFQPLDEILYFKACDKYAEMHCFDGSMSMIFHSLAELENRLNCGTIKGPRLFFRIHRQYIAAIHHAKKWPENLQLKLENDLALPVSRKQSEILRKTLMVAHEGI